MVHTIRLGRSDYIDYGGQGLIMDKTQFIKLMNKIKSVHRCTYTYSSLHGDVEDINDYMGVDIPDDNVVKFKKILGRNRKVYKKKGNGNVLYVKVKGQEITLKEARVLDAEHLKSKKNKGK